MKRTCLICGTLIPRGSRCPAHQLAEHPRGNAWNPVRQTILERDHGICHICRKPGATVVDHIIPRARGGSNDPSNLAAAHAACNLTKGRR